MRGGHGRSLRTVRDRAAPGAGRCLPDRRGHRFALPDPSDVLVEADFCLLESTIQVRACIDGHLHGVQDEVDRSIDPQSPGWEEFGRGSQRHWLGAGSLAHAMSTTAGRPTPGSPAADGGEAVPRVRRSREELREIVLVAGRDLLLSEGLGTGAEHLSFKRVLSRVADTLGIRVTNASVIGRIWDNQEQFQNDVIRSIVQDQGEEEVRDTSEAMVEVLGRLDVSTAELRRASLAELVRVSCAQYLESASTSSATIQMALITYVAASQATDAESPLIASFRMMNEKLTTEYMGMYDAGLQAVGWRMRPGLTLRSAALAISAFAEGTLLRMVVDPKGFEPIVQVSPMDGQEVEWTLLAIGMNSMIDFFAEPDPDWPA
jgi:hypothetical protein